MTVLQSEAPAVPTVLVERLDHLFEEQCDWIQASGRAQLLAVDAGEVTLTFEQLDARANQLARYLLAGGARPGDRIALLFDQAVHSYVGMLAVLKINAAYVPLDVGFPPERVSYIVADTRHRSPAALHTPRLGGGGVRGGGSACGWDAAGACGGVSDDGVVPVR